MFDRVIVQAGPSHVSVDQKTTVHEHRAPTDKSVELLKEMREKAIDSIIESAVLVGDGVEVAYAMFGADFSSSGHRVDLLFRFNGKDERITATISGQEMARYRHDKRAFLKLVCEKVAAAIAANLNTRLLTPRDM